MNRADTTDDGRILEVALSIRKRHVLYLLQNLKKVVAEFHTTMELRRKRARLIRLARKRRWHGCVKGLRASGMTIGVSPDSRWFRFDHSLTNSFKRSLMLRIEDLRRDYRAFKEQSVDVIIGNLRGILEDGELIAGPPPRVRLMVEAVELEDVWIGNLQVTMSLWDFDVDVSNLSVNVKSKGGYQHPHVNSSGSICWNEHEATARAFHASGDFLPLRDLIENLLRTYNPASPYITLHHWANGLGELCCDCDEYCDPDDLAYSNQREGSLCSGCRRHCDECDDYVSEDSYNSHLDACDSCVESGSALCDQCGKRFWNSDLRPLEIEGDDGTETVQACDSCRREHLEEQEEEEEEDEDNEDHADTPCLLASAMDGAPDAVRGFVDGPACSRKGRPAHRGFHSCATGGKPYDG